ncbi:hypothetical protein T552_00060 [Pneumocystis carinii B80]|uniref:Vacuolar import and degradation protein 21 n=1 Tax=Pneumocystis carinii (strain B80) TaxID=1408658 RepID=A0A0W4ZSQ6_PNEC8|nr:hypothetical protein T552_00060 [Pneumocystis carinii B80]KTW31416.1 hypothetical protein T552_00060 [Pneumocystis carinii B80]
MSIDLSKNEKKFELDTSKEILEEKIELKKEIELRQKELLTELFILSSLEKYFPDISVGICEKITSSDELKTFLLKNSLQNGLIFDESTLQSYIFSQEDLASSKESGTPDVTQTPFVEPLPENPEKTEICDSPSISKDKVVEEELKPPIPYTSIEPSVQSSDYFPMHVPRHSPSYKQNKASNTDLLSWLIQTSSMPIYKLIQTSNKIIVTKDWNTAIIETKFIKVLERINKLKENNLWSFRQMIKQKTPSRLKAHWDFMLDEMRWLQADFKEERKWKIVLAKQIANWIMDWHRLKTKSDICFQPNLSKPYTSLSKNEKYNVIDCNAPFYFSKNDMDLSENLVNKDNKNNKNKSFSDTEFEMKNVSSENIFTLHSSPLFIIENAVQLLEIPPDKIVATFSNILHASNTVLPDLPVYRPPVPEDTLYYDPLDEMKIIPLSKYTQSHIKISNSDKFFKKRKREASIDTDDISDKQRILINEFSLSNSPSTTRKKSAYPSQLRPPNIPLNPENRKPIWNPDEDNLLMTYLPKYQFNWEFVAQTLTPSIKWISPAEKKTAWDCFERWAQLDPHASNVIFVGPYAKTAYAKLEPLLKNSKSNNYGGIMHSKKDVAKNPLNCRFKRQHQFNMFDAIRKTMKKREVSQKLNVAPSKKVNTSVHDTHGLPHKPPIVAPTPLDLSRLKHERDQVITQACIRQRNAVVALALQNQARSSGRSSFPEINSASQQMAQMQSVNAQINLQNRVQNASHTIPEMVNGLRFNHSVHPSIPSQTLVNPTGATPILRLPPGVRLSQEQMQQLVIQRQQLLQAQRTQVQNIQQTAHCSDSDQNEIPVESRHLASLNQH